MSKQQPQFSSLKKRSHFLSRRFRSSSSSTNQPQIQEWKEQQQQQQHSISILVDEEHNKKKSQSTKLLGRRISGIFHNKSNRLSVPPSPSPTTTTRQLNDTTDLTDVNNYNYRHSSDETYYKKSHHININNNNNNNNSINNHNHNNLITSLFNGGRRSRSSSANIAMTEKIEIDSEEIPEYALRSTTVSSSHHHRPSFKEVLWNSCPGIDQFSRSRTSSVEKYNCHHTNNNSSSLPSTSSQQQEPPIVIMMDKHYVHSTTSTEEEEYDDEEEEEEAIMTPKSATTCSDVMFWDMNNIHQNEIIYNNKNNKKINLAEQVHKVLGNAFHEADKELEEKK